MTNIYHLTPPAAGIGHNSPPSSLVDVHRARIEDLYAEAKNWCDGEPITSQEQADEIGRLLAMIRNAEKAAEASRVEENAPFDQGKAAVQAKYAPLIGNTKLSKGMAVKATEACKSALTPWLIAVAAENERQAAIARETAAEKARQAAEAARSAVPNDLEAQDQAEALFKEARLADRDAARAEAARATVAGGERAVTLRSYYILRLINGAVACRHYWSVNPQGLIAAVTALAEADVRCGKRQIPGFIVEEERRPV